MGPVIRAVLALIVVTVIGGMGLILLAVRQMASPVTIEQPVVFSIPPGRGMNAVAADLGEQGIIDSPRVFALYARAVGLAGNIKAGEYDIEPGQTLLGLLEQFVEGRVLLHAVTIIEGWTFAEAVGAIRSHPAITPTTASLDEVELAALLEIEGASPEGWLFPETYLFERNTADLEVLRRARRAMAEELDEAWLKRQEGLPIKTPYQALILASIIEKETALESERARIAGVFTRRLQRGMRLQTDPTVIYGLGNAFDGDLRRVHLQTDTPYNTYTRKGLPPTPIALPGRGALQAAVRPADGDELYFVATGEPDGSHYFSETLEEHNRAVSRYLAKRRQGQKN